MYQISIEEVSKRIQIRHLGKIKLIPHTYIKVKEKAKFIDVDFGEFECRVDCVLSGQTHPQRAKAMFRKNRAWPREKIEKLLQEIHGDIVTLGNDYTKAAAKCTFFDKEYGEWISTPLSVCDGSRHPHRWKQSLSKHFKTPKKEAEKRLFEIHGNTLKIGDDYKGVCAYCTFIDKDYGEWRAQFNHVLGGMSHPKRKQTKIAKSYKKHPVVFHWKTNTPCYSQSSWEYATLLFFNQNQIDFDWQIPFETPMVTNKRKKKAIYFVDAYIKDGKWANTYIEIKGSWHRRKTTSIDKWEWFHNAYPNSQLWMLNELKENGILTNKGAINQTLLKC